MNEVIIRIFIFILAILSGFVLYYYVFRKGVLYPLCLVESNGCARVEYFKYNNSVLCEIKKSGLWVWFNGDRAFVYGQPVGQICDSNYEAAYAINVRNGLKEGYMCVLPLEQVIKFYNEKGIKSQNIVKRANDNFDVYDLLNLLNNEGIINLKEAE